MVQMTEIPANEQENVLSSFWTMLQECESKADDGKNAVLRHWVVQWYAQWNRITGDSKEPRFVTRSREGADAKEKVFPIQKADARPIAGDPRLFIEGIGYDIDTDSDQPGLWIWTAPSDGCSSSFHTAKEALEGAWNDAVAQTLSISEISCEDWGQMDFDAQRVAMTMALAGEIPALSELSPDTQMEWVEKVREVYPDIGPKEAFRLACQEYLDNDGVIPKPAVKDSPKG
jgi:hypothetical protein